MALFLLKGEKKLKKNKTNKKKHHTLFEYRENLNLYAVMLLVAIAEIAEPCRKHTKEMDGCRLLRHSQV